LLRRSYSGALARGQAQWPNGMFVMLVEAASVRDIRPR